MTNEPQTSDHEPTLYDVIDLLHGMDRRIDARLDKNEKLATSTHSRVENLAEQVADTHRGVISLEHRTADMQDTLDIAVDVQGRHASTIKNHEGRIKSLEKSPV